MQHITTVDLLKMPSQIFRLVSTSSPDSYKQVPIYFEQSSQTSGPPTAGVTLDLIKSFCCTDIDESPGTSTTLPAPARLLCSDLSGIPDPPPPTPVLRPSLKRRISGTQGSESSKDFPAAKYRKILPKLQVRFKNGGMVRRLHSADSTKPAWKRDLGGPTLSTFGEGCPAMSFAPAEL